MNGITLGDGVERNFQAGNLPARRVGVQGNVLKPDLSTDTFQLFRVGQLVPLAGFPPKEP
jgi:hypothetical protein